jgi:serine/threonine protein kinase
LGAGRKRNVEIHNKVMLGGSSEELHEENATHDFELPFLKFQDILVATDNFSNSYMIGQGGFGKVYKVTIYTMTFSAFFPSLILESKQLHYIPQSYFSLIITKGKLEDGQEVAIKRLSRDSDQGIQEFRNEVILIAKLQHRNLVRLLGCCVEGDEKLLIYEYLPNKSLDAIIFSMFSSYSLFNRVYIYLSSYKLSFS